MRLTATKLSVRKFHAGRLAALALLPMLALATPALAQQGSNDIFKGFQSGSKGPVNVEADSLDVIEKDGQRVSSFTGNVTVTRGDSVLKAQKISIFSPMAKKADPAAAAKPADTAAKPADAKPADTKPADAKPAAAPAADNSLLPGAGSFTRIEASGKVYVASGPQTATGDNAVVDMIAKQVTLSGNVVLSQGQNILTGDKLIWDMQTGRARVEQKPGGRIRGIFTPNSTPASGAQ